MIASAGARIDGTSIRSPAGHAWTFDETERRLGPLLDRVPITRVFDATALDRLGLPVWGAVTPLARDLTVHAGKGASPQAARLSAIMEAIERVSAEDADPSGHAGPPLAALAAEAPGGVIDPDEFDLDFTAHYGPDAVHTWVQGEDLFNRQPVWVALDLALSPARGEICSGPNSNGLAAGNTHVEAVLHALYEVIERDADARRRFLRAFAEGEERAETRPLRRDSLPAPIVDWIDALEAANVFVAIEDITHDIGVPVFRALLSDRGFPGREGASTTFEGLGCDLDTANAVMRALSEAVQAHTSVLLGARDDFSVTERGLSPGRLLAGLMTPSRSVDLQCLPAPVHLEARLDPSARLRAVGLERCAVVDLTRGDLGIPVVRVLVPGAAGPDNTRRPSLRLLRQLTLP